MKNSFPYLFRNESILLIALLLIILTFSFYSHTHTQTLASACNWKVQFCGPIHAPPGNTNFLKRIMESIPLFGETCTPGAFVTGVTKEGVLVCKKIETHGVCASLPEGTPPTTANACESGAYHNTPTDTPTHYRFHCNGIGGGNNASCTIKKPSCPSITKQWTQGSNTCTTTIPTTDSGSTTTAQDTTFPLTGTALYSCTSGVWTTPLSSKTCANTTPINGGWSSYSSYTPCTKACGGGTQTKRRTCSNPSPQHGGNECTKENNTKTTPQNRVETQTQQCNTQRCTLRIQGGWTRWSWTGDSCSTRTCSNPIPYGPDTECTRRDGTRTVGSSNIGSRMEIDITASGCSALLSTPPTITVPYFPRGCAKIVPPATPITSYGCGVDRGGGTSRGVIPHNFIDNPASDFYQWQCAKEIPYYPSPRYTYTSFSSSWGCSSRKPGKITLPSKPTNANVYKSGRVVSWDPPLDDGGTPITKYQLGLGSRLSIVWHDIPGGGSVRSFTGTFAQHIAQGIRACNSKGCGPAGRD